MHTWFECKVRYEKVMENGITKTVTEPYLVDALSFTEAETRIVKEVQHFINGDFLVSAIRRVNYSELFYGHNDSDDRWYCCKVEFIALDEKRGTERKTKVNMLVQAENPSSAVDNLNIEMKSSLMDYSIVSITETAIYDVFPYNTDNRS